MKPSTRRVLAFLRQHPDGVTTHDLIQHCTHKFAARLHELRREGHVIEAKRLRDGAYRYRLISSPASGSAAHGTPTASSPPAGPSGDGASNPGRSSVAVEPDAAELFDVSQTHEARNAALEDYEEAA